MIGNCFLKIVLFCIISFVVCVIGVIITFFTQGQNIAEGVFYSYIFDFNGVLIVGFGYGLLWFIRNTGTQSFNSLFNILEIPDEHKLILHGYYNKWALNKKRNHIASIIITIIGGTILWKCGYPYYGFAKYFLAITSISLFYIAGQMSGYFISTILVYRKLDDINSEIKIKNGSSPYEMEKLNLSFTICSTLGVIALYLAFRGTLTANFVNNEMESIFRKLLIYPIVCFLPGILFTSFYYRYVLRKIEEKEIIHKIETLESLSRSEIIKTSNTKEKLEMEKLLIEIKEKLILEKTRFPFLSLKDSPALLIALALFIQFLFQNDNALYKYLIELIK